LLPQSLKCEQPTGTCQKLLKKNLADFGCPIALQKVETIRMILKTVFLLLFGAAGSGYATTLFFFDTPVALASVGDTFDLNVELITNVPVAAFAFDIAFPTFLEVNSAPVEEGFFFNNGCCYDPGTIDNVNGVISGINDVSIFDSDTGIDMLVQIQFTAVAPGEGQISFQNVSLSDPDFNLISIDPLGAVNVDATTPEPATWAMAGLGIALVIARHLRRVIVDSDGSRREGEKIEWQDPRPVPASRRRYR
jgi:hypothetical protein